MRKTILFLFLILCPLSSADVGIGDFEARIFTHSDFAFDMPYRLFIPRNYTPARSYPLVLYLHSSGGLGRDNVKNVEIGARIWAEPEKQEQYPCFIAAPQILNSFWEDSVETVTLRLVEALTKEFNISENRIYLTGTSLGGRGTWVFLLNHPDRFAAAVPVCGWSTPEQADRITHVPIWIFHGEMDHIVWVQHSREIYQALKDLSAPYVIYTEFQGYGHEIAGMVYHYPELAKWLFAQNKGIRHNPPPSPADVAAATGEREIHLSWNRAGEHDDPDMETWYFQVLRDGEKIDTTRWTHYHDTGLIDATLYSYEVRAVNYCLMESEKNPILAVTTQTDTTPPKIDFVHIVETSEEGAKVRVVFSEPMDQAGVMDVQNYRITPGLQISAVETDQSPQTAVLNLPPLDPKTEYALSVKNVQDGSRSGNTIRTAAQSGFHLEDWMWTDIGSYERPGSFSVDKDQALLSGTTNDVCGTVNAFTYAYRQVSGDFTLSARIDAIAASHPNSKAGIMIRESLDPGSSNVSVFVSKSSLLFVGMRKHERGETSRSLFKDSVSLPIYVKLERRGGKIHIAHSLDGVVWEEIWKGNKATLRDMLKVGLCAASFEKNGQKTTASFAQVEISAPPSAGMDNPLPIPKDKGVRIIGAYPNPFNAFVRIQYQVESLLMSPQEPVHAKVYNILGRVVHQSIIRSSTAGASVGFFTWDGTDDRDVKQGSGCYLIEIRSGEYRDNVKIVLIQ
jgi:acetyl esterase/lipase/regulation of enolase protein 1 (concanavalin A-like superfamily)